jgi:hypothetical protein
MNLDDAIPNPHYRMCHSRIVGAPPTVVWDELYRVTMSALPLGRALEGMRLLPARLSGRKRPPLAGRTFLDVTPIPVLFSERPHVVISARGTRPPTPRPKRPFIAWWGSRPAAKVRHCEGCSQARLQGSHMRSGASKQR